MKIMVIAGRELQATFNTTIGWLVLCGYLLLTGLFWVAMIGNYVSQANDLVYNPYGAAYLNLTDHLVLPFFGNCTVIFIMICPALSMRVFSEEYNQKTIELLFTAPVSTAEIVLGKFIGLVGFVTVLLLCTAHYPIMLYTVAAPELGVWIGGYVALLVLAAALLSMGMMFSSMTSNQIVALVLSFASSLGLYIVSWLGADPESWLAHISISSHIIDLMQGELRLSDMVYFAGFIGFFLTLTHQRVESHRWQ
jgi:ABC-2 type transport system permease protein